MRGAAVVLVRRAITDMALDDDQCRRVMDGAERLEGLRESLRVIGVANVQHVPAISAETRRDVLAECEIRVAFDGYAVAVIDPAQIAEHEAARERGRFAGDALHHVAVAAHRVNIVVENLETGPIEVLRQPAFADRHANACGAALAQWPGRRLDARRHMIFGMAGALAADLAKGFDIVERNRGLGEDFRCGIDRLDAGKMQHGVEQHRRMSVGQDETVTVRPDRIFRIITQETLPQRVNHWRQSHRRSGMSGVGLLHGVHG